jgi:sec-independent protein translocase protein TatA
MFGFFPTLGPWELGLILLIVLLIFGPGKLPDVGRFLGKGFKEFKSAVNKEENNKLDSSDDEVKDIDEENIKKAD